MESEDLTSGEMTTYAWDDDGRLITTTVAGNVIRLYSYSQDVDLLWAEVEDITTTFAYDGAGLVRQTADETAAITLAWTFSPDGGVVLGEEGPVTHLGCDDNAVYDWSTGLIFKNGRYFDPRLGLWLLAPFMIVFGLWRPRRRRKGRKRSPPDRFYTMLLLLLVVALPLAGCGGQQTSTPTPTCTLTPTPGLPGDTPNPPAPTPGNPSTPTPGQPTPTPGPPDTPTPEPPTAEPTPTPDATPTADRWRITYQDLIQHEFDWDRYFLENSGETEAVVMARFGVGEAAPGNTYDQDLIMWTLRIRKEIGLVRSGRAASINAVVTNGGAYETLLVLKGETGGSPYTNPGAVAEEGRCGENVIKMTYPCTPADVNTLNRAYVKARGILSTDIHNAPSELRYFESFEGAGGTEGTYCHWGDTDTTRLRPSARLAGPGGTVFQDCVLRDNQEIWGQE